MSPKESLIRGAAALAVAGLFVKVTGLFVRLPLTHLIGAEGLGIYQIALPVFSALFHLAAGGVPVAVQNLVAEAYAKGRRVMAEQVFQYGMTYSVITGGLASCLLLATAPVVADLLGDPRAYYALVAVAPAILLFAVDHLYRHYLQGRKLMTPSAIANVMEQAVKMGVSLAGAYLLIGHGRPKAAAGAALGITVGALVSLAYMSWTRRRLAHAEGPVDRWKDRPEPPRLLIRRMVHLAWPVTIGAITLPMLGLVDVGIIQRGFQAAGHSVEQATALYGIYQGIAVQIVWFPFVLTNAFASALVPVLAAAKAQNDWATVRERVCMGIRAAALICMPIAIGLALLSRPIVDLFGEPAAAEPLLYMAPVAFIGPLVWLMGSQLQALGVTGVHMRNLGIGWGLKICADYVVARIPGVDVKGVALVTVGMFVLVCIWNARALGKELDEHLPWGQMLRGPVISSVVMGAVLAGLVLSGVIPKVGWGVIALFGVVAPVLYLGMLALTRSVTWAEIRELGGPTVAKLERWFQALWHSN